MSALKNWFFEVVRHDVGLKMFAFQVQCNEEVVSDEEESEEEVRSCLMLTGEEELLVWE